MESARGSIIDRSIASLSRCAFDYTASNNGGTSFYTEAECRNDDACFRGVGVFGAPHMQLEDSMATRSTATTKHKVSSILVANYSQSTTRTVVVLRTVLDRQQ